MFPREIKLEFFMCICKPQNLFFHMLACKISLSPYSESEFLLNLCDIIFWLQPQYCLWLLRRSVIHLAMCLLQLRSDEWEQSWTADVTLMNARSCCWVSPLVVWWDDKIQCLIARQAAQTHCFTLQEFIWGNNSWIFRTEGNGQYSSCSIRITVVWLVMRDGIELTVYCYFSVLLKQIWIGKFDKICFSVLAYYARSY